MKQKEYKSNQFNTDFQYKLKHNSIHILTIILCDNILCRGGVEEVYYYCECCVISCVVVFIISPGAYAKRSVLALISIIPNEGQQDRE
jgi:hypothetical protein